MRRKFLLLLIIFLGLCITVLTVLFFQPYFGGSTGKLGVPFFRRTVPKTKVLLIGINGLDWKLLQRFSAGGSLKVLPELMSGGSYGLVTTYTKDSEEAIWVTICTGYLPEHHGINSFINGQSTDPDNPENSPNWQNGSSRTRWSIWEIASYYDREVMVVGWPVSWPADSVLGYLVSDRLHLFNPQRSISGDQGLCHPSWILKKLYPVIEKARNSSANIFNTRFMEDSSNLDSYVSQIWAKLEHTVPHQSFSRFNPMESVGNSFFKDNLNLEVLLYLVQEYGQKNLTACYFENLDRVSHLFSYSAGISSAKQKGNNKVRARESGFSFLRNYYEYMDRMVGSIIQNMDPETILFLVSGHGFNLEKGDHRDGPAGWFLLHGNGIRTTKNIEGVVLADIAPTILYLLGLPVPQDMDGEVIYDAFTLSHLEKHRISDWPESSKQRLPRLRTADPIDSQLKLNNIKE